MIFRFFSLSFTFLDALDILLVTLSIYFFLRLLRGTRAIQIFFGILPVVGLWIIANLLRLDALNQLLSFLIPIVGIAFVVVFQPELRRLLSEIGRWNFLKTGNGSIEERLIDEIVGAVKVLAQNKTGGIIVLMNEAAIISSLANPGVKIDAEISKELLVTIFQTSTPLHDGAVIIDDNRIINAAAILPLSDELRLSGKYGTRHRAGLGLAEETDAFVIIISEETGGICIAQDRKLEGPVSVNTLKRKLKESRQSLSMKILKKTHVNSGGENA